MESRRNGPQLSSRHDDDEFLKTGGVETCLKCGGSFNDCFIYCKFNAMHANVHK